MAIDSDFLAVVRLLFEPHGARCALRESDAPLSRLYATRADAGWQSLAQEDATWIAIEPVSERAALVVWGDDAADRAAALALLPRVGRFCAAALLPSQATEAMREAIHKLNNVAATILTNAIVAQELIVSLELEHADLKRAISYTVKGAEELAEVSHNIARQNQ